MQATRLPPGRPRPSRVDREVPDGPRRARGTGAERDRPVVGRDVHGGHSATIVYFWREQRAEFDWFKHLVVPIIGFIFMIPAFLGVVGGVTVPIIKLELAA